MVPTVTTEARSDSVSSIRAVGSDILLQFLGWLRRSDFGKPVSISSRNLVLSNSGSSQTDVSRFALQRGSMFGETESQGTAGGLSGLPLRVTIAKTSEQLSMPAAHRYWLPLSAGPPVSTANQNQSLAKMFGRCGASGGWKTVGSGLGMFPCSSASNKYAAAISRYSVLRDEWGLETDPALGNSTATWGEADNEVSGKVGGAACA
jgi:hypothetical protein